MGTKWIVLYISCNRLTYFDSFDTKHIPKEIKKFIGDRNVIKNIFKIQAYT